MIELSNGTVRRVEELRTEDFVMSAEKSDSLQIEDSTVVRIHQSNSSSNCVIITFSYENNKSKVSKPIDYKQTAAVGFLLIWRLHDDLNICTFSRFRLTLKHAWTIHFSYTAKAGSRLIPTSRSSAWNWNVRSYKSAIFAYHSNPVS